MHPVDKVLFNALASHTAVSLPGIGGLAVVRRAAGMKGREKVISPRYVVLYDRQGNAGTPIRDLIAIYTGDEARAGALYEEWLGGLGVQLPAGSAPAPYRIGIDEVGEIADGKFTPAPELEALLNPGVPATMKLKPRLRNWHITLLLLLVVAGGAAAYVHYFVEIDRYEAYARRESRKAAKRDRERRSKGLETATTSTMAELEKQNRPVRLTAAGDSVGSGEKPAAQSSTPQAQKPAQTAAATAGTPSGDPAGRPADQPAANPVAQQSVQSSGQIAPSAAGTYYVVLGVYSTSENAAKSVRELTAKDSSLQCAIVRMPSGKFMVSAFASASSAQSGEMKTQLAGKYPAVWIYKQN